LVVCNVQTVLY